MYMFDDELQTDDHIKLNIGSPSLNYGLSLFETIKVYKGRPQLLDEHVKRINGSLKEVGFIHVCDVDSIRNRIDKLLSSVGKEYGAVKLMVVDDIKKCHEIISYSERIYDKSLYESGYKVCVSKCARDENSPLVQHKSSNYGTNIIEYKKAVSEGYNEVIFLNTQGYITEGALSNLFLIKDKVLYTPDVDSGILPGVMRKKVLDIATKLNLNTVEDKLTIDDVYEADELFITNSLMGLMPICEISGKKRDITSYKVSSKLYNELKMALGED